jgi:mRNA interferase YafQ
MLIPDYTTKFKKDLSQAQKRKLNISLLRGVISDLIEEKKLSKKYQDHPLSGNYKGFRDCHIEPDWILIYKTRKGIIVFARTGTHSDLY